ncbi:30S ribosomal protein S4 [Candidatus Kaiserbacteria bacterium]|nr:30S ribosomal protein S4 [Candidatus Kaiserbacteria bacterium]
MLIVKSKYRIAKRLGAAVFDQTQTQKFALREANSTKRRQSRGASDYGRQLLEKQRARFTYGLSEKQLSKYAKAAYVTEEPSKSLHQALEMRADNAVYRGGLASTRRAARQAVSHGHFTINGKRITTPSFRVKKGDVIAVRDGARKSPLYAGLAEKNQEGSRAIPSWLSADLALLKVEVTGEPQYSPEVGLDYSTVFEFYSR